MQFELNERLAVGFADALERSGEEREKVIERLFKTYIYDTYSRKTENYDGLDHFMKLPRNTGKGN